MPGEISRDVIVVGTGIVAMCCASALAARGLSVTIVGDEQAGAASRAAAGLLAPTIEAATGSVFDFSLAARDRYPGFLDALFEATGERVSLDRSGILRVALTEADAHSLQHDAAAQGVWLDSAQLAEREPSLSHALGAVLHPIDGFVDNVALLDGLHVLAGRSARIDRSRGRVTTVTLNGSSIGCTTEHGIELSAEFLVLAAGAWSHLIDGLPRGLHIEPLRGQMTVLESSPLSRAVFIGARYLVPRAPGRTLIGSTWERAGFDPATTTEALAALDNFARSAVPVLRDVGRIDAWAGLRPMTPDGLPILGTDPDHPRLLYACGHSRNGVLMAPLTGDCLADLIAEGRSAVDISPFTVARFDT